MTAIAGITIGIAASLAGGNMNPTTIVVFVGVAITALLTLRSNVAKIWRENYEGAVEEVKRLTKQLDDLREAKHAVETELATTTNQLAAERAKPDLTGILVKIGEQQQLLEHIAAIIRGREINGGS